MAIIEFKNIYLKFKTKTIFKDFNFSINSGDKVVVFGKSGTGKSTLLNLLLGFEQPQSGSVFVHSKKLTSKNIWKIRSQIAYVDQGVVMGDGLVSEIIAEYFFFEANAKNQFSQNELITHLESFGLDSTILDKKTDQLSGGERQRLAIVIALMLKRSVLVLDEVTSSLDPASKDTVINQILKNKKSTLLIITHDKEWQHQKGVRIFDFKGKLWIQ